MPVNILPKDEPDWIEFSLKSGILFTDIDPFWKTRTGNDPNNATVYRGGQGFFDRSTDGGKTWSNIRPSTNPPWFVGGDDMWDSSFSKFEPMPRPANGEPSYDNEIAGPIPSQLRYQAYSGSSARAGEHVVLCAYTVANSAGYLDQGDFNNELELGWVLYTFDDWSTHGWHQLLLSVDRGIGAYTQGNALELRDEASNVDSSQTRAIQVGSGRFAVFFRTGGFPSGTAHCINISESGGDFVVDGSASSSAGVENHNYTIDDPIFADSSGHVYFSDFRIEEDPPGTNRCKVHVTEWDCSGLTPSVVGSWSSDFLPDYSATTDFSNMNGSAVFLTDSGRLLFRYWCGEDNNPNQGEDRKHFWLYYDTATNTFSSEHELYDGPLEAEGTAGAAPRDVTMTAQSLGGNKIACAYVEGWTWNGRGTTDWIGEVFIMTVGVWSKLSTIEYVNQQTSSSRAIGLRNSKIWSNNRFCIYSPHSYQT